MSSRVKLLDSLCNLFFSLSVMGNTISSCNVFLVLRDRRSTDQTLDCIVNVPVSQVQVIILQVVINSINAMFLL